MKDLNITNSEFDIYMKSIDFSNVIGKTHEQLLLDRAISKVAPYLLNAFWILLSLFIAYVVIKVILELYIEAPRTPKKKKETKKEKEMSATEAYILYDTFFKK